MLAGNELGTGADEGLRKRYLAAVEAFLEKIRPDPSILAVVVSGSLAYDVIWEKSDIDMTVVVRDQLLKTDSYSIDEDGILLNLSLVTRSDFRRTLERNAGGSFGQAYYAKGQMVYAVDGSLREFFEQNRAIGEDDKALSMMMLAGMLISEVEKSKKWLIARKDPQYAQYFLTSCAEIVANMELCLRGEPASRASIQKAAKLNPDLMHQVYTRPLSHLYTAEEVAESIAYLEGYLRQHIELIGRPVLEFLSDGEIKTGTLIGKHFHHESHFLVLVFDWLADEGVIEKAAQTIRLIAKGRQIFEEIGYLYMGEL